MSTSLRPCVACGKPVTQKPYQKDSARACSPICAHTIMVREHPELRTKLDREPYNNDEES